MNTDNTTTATTNKLTVKDLTNLFGGQTAMGAALNLQQSQIWYWTKKEAISEHYIPIIVQKLASIGKPIDEAAIDHLKSTGRAGRKPGSKNKNSNLGVRDEESHDTGVETHEEDAEEAHTNDVIPTTTTTVVAPVVVPTVPTTVPTAIATENVAETATVQVTAEPKRRGRKPGSKNKPKDEVQPEIPTETPVVTVPQAAVTPTVTPVIAKVETAPVIAPVVKTVTVTEKAIETSVPVIPAPTVTSPTNETPKTSKNPFEDNQTEYKEGDPVTITLSPAKLEHSGIVRGKASNNLSLVGPAWIVELITPLEGYAYSNVIAFGCNIKHRF
jgi:hypothetical protein